MTTSLHNTHPISEVYMSKQRDPKLRTLENYATRAKEVGVLESIEVSKVNEVLHVKIKLTALPQLFEYTSLGEAVLFLDIMTHVFEAGKASC